MKHHQHPQHKLTRRSFLKGATALSMGTFAARSAAATVAHAEEAAGSYHGAQLRGMYLPAKDRSAEGRFGLMFKRLPAFAPDNTLLTDLGLMMKEKSDQDDAEHLNSSPKLFAGFTFLGQFIDHDITLDTTPLDLQEKDPDALINFRTPRYDLDSIYGKGPVAEPQYYDPNDRDKLLLKPNIHGVEDVPRDAEGRAIIPEGRNDENLIIVQLHIAFMKFHNKLVDYVRSRGVLPASVFEAARRLARWHYQWMVIHEFLPAHVGQTMADQVYKEREGEAPRITLNYYKPTNRDDLPFMPVEFAVAAYRFGHSMVRPIYIINAQTQDGIPVFEAEADRNLNGRRPIPADLVVEWKNILPVDPATPARKPRKIDTRLSSPLFNMPGSVVPPPDPQTLLGVRNLLRGKQVGLPSGQQVAKAMRKTPLSNEELGLDARWKEAPLWYYILKEAELAPNNGEKLGEVGGRIVAEVLVGLLQRDKTSYLYLDPAWKPSPPIAPEVGKFTIVDLLRYAGGVPALV